MSGPRALTRSASGIHEKLRDICLTEKASSPVLDLAIALPHWYRIENGLHHPA